MLMQGKMIRLLSLGEGLHELVFDNRQGANILGRACIEELSDAITLLYSREDLKGLLLSSDHEEFMTEADIQAFVELFRRPDAQLRAGIQQVRRWLQRLEQLPVPTVAAINGKAQGGGLELCLACDFRLAAQGSTVALPEVNLGLMPGWGGSVRLPRLIGLDPAIDWICSGRQVGAQEARAQGLLDALVAPQQLRAAALTLLRRVLAGDFNWRDGRYRKQQPLPLSKLAVTLAVDSARARIAARVGEHYPAPLLALDTLRRQAHLGAEEAQQLELESFVQLARTPQARALTDCYLKERQLCRQADRVAGRMPGVKHPGVIGAGVMGSAIACQMALKLGPVVLKDLQVESLRRGLDGAAETLAEAVRKGQLDADTGARVPGRITPTLDFESFRGVDLVVEAVAENPGVKARVLAEVESRLAEDALLASNTSAIPISVLARALRRPERFCGLHFFNPVARMRLVEIVRGDKTSAQTIRRAQGVVRSLGRIPVVVRDGPGFLVNRVLFAWLLGFNLLLRDGVDYQRIDRLMEAYGWPLGPARLVDLIGLDIARSASAMMAAGYPERMTFPGESLVDRLVTLKRLGQKSGRGFYRYPAADPRRGTRDPQLAAEIGDLVVGEDRYSDREILDRMMIPLLLESARALEEKVVGSAAEADLALILGIGYPAFRGGPFHTLDTLGLARFVARCNRYASLGPLHEPPLGMRQMAVAGELYGASVKEEE